MIGILNINSNGATSPNINWGGRGKELKNFFKKIPYYNGN